MKTNGLSKHETAVCEKFKRILNALADDYDKSRGEALHLAATLTLAAVVSEIDEDLNNAMPMAGRGI